MDIAKVAEIELAFSKLQDKYYNGERNGTSCEDVLQYMVDHPEIIWHWSYSFVGQRTSKGGFLSHRSPARASDLALHTDLVQARKIGRLCVYRLKIEKLAEIKKYLNEN
jgi:hypothetical protein